MDEKLLFLVAVLDSRAQWRLTHCYDTLCSHGFVGQQTKEMPYHFTLGSCNAAPDAEARLSALMDDAAAQFEPIEISLGYLGLFDLRVLFAAPNMNTGLMRLQERFFPASANGCHDWAAHATLLIDEPDVIMRALPIATQSFSSVDTRIERLELYELFPARLIKAVELGQQPHAIHTQSK